MKEREQWVETCVRQEDGEGGTGEASDILKAQSSGEDPRATGGLASSLPHAWDNKTKQHTPTIDGAFVIRVYKYIL